MLLILREPQDGDMVPQDGEVGSAELWIPAFAGMTKPRLVFRDLSGAAGVTEIPKLLRENKIRFGTPCPGNRIMTGERNMRLYFIIAHISAVICTVFGRWQVIGKENVPKTGGVLLCGNHVSYIDPPALGARCGRHAHFMAKIELFQMPVLGFIIKAIGAFPVKRGTADRGALKTAIEYLQNGEAVAMFPEGQRSLGKGLLPAEAGVGMIVLRAKVPVIPVALVNTNKLLPPGSPFFHFTKLIVVYGEPVKLDDLYDQGGREAIEEVGKRIMAAIGELMEKYKTD